MIRYFGFQYIFCITIGAPCVRIVLTWTWNEGTVALNMNLIGRMYKAEESAWDDWDGILPSVVV